jgi:hypothetical protein
VPGNYNPPAPPPPRPEHITGKKFFIPTISRTSKTNTVESFPPFGDEPSCFLWESQTRCYSVQVGAFYVTVGDFFFFRGLILSVTSLWMRALSTVQFYIYFQKKNKWASQRLPSAG